MADDLNAARLRELRERHGWSQQRLAEQAGVDQSVVSRFERGIQEDFRVSILVALARALKTSVDDLLLDPPHSPEIDPALSPELLSALARLRDVSPAHQRQLAAIIETYLATLPS